MGLDILPGEHPIIPVMVGDAAKTGRMADYLLERGVYITPSNGLHWIISTAHKQADIEHLIVVADDACAALG